MLLPKEQADLLNHMRKLAAHNQSVLTQFSNGK